MPKPIRGEIEVTVPVAPEQLWPLVADTDRMDRAAGLPPASYTRQPPPEGGELVQGEYRLAGRPYARWIEPPFEWTGPRHFAVARDYQSGPLRRFVGGTELTPVAGGTRLRSFVEITPRADLLAPLVRHV